MKNVFKKVRGFTLVEILVVLAIIAILASIVLASISGARQNSRDKARIVDIEQIQFALRLNVEQTGSYPTGYDSGIIIGSGGALDPVISQYLGSAPADPVNNATYRYMYDSSFDCDGTNKAVLYIDSFETISSSNIGTKCSVSHAGSGDEYIIILE